MTSPYVCSATPGHELIDKDGKGWPIVAWEISGLHAKPLTLLPVARAAQAVIFPDGQVVDFDTEECYADTKSWREATKDVERNPDKLRGGTVDAKDVGTEISDDTKSIRDLGLSGRACAPMEREGIKTVGDLASWTRAAVLDIKGVPKDAGSIFDAALEEAGLSWSGARKAEEPVEEDDDDDDLEDLI